jgi:hypothetical protein
LEAALYCPESEICNTKRAVFLSEKGSESLSVRGGESGSRATDPRRWGDEPKNLLLLFGELQTHHTRI